MSYKHNHSKGPWIENEKEMSIYNRNTKISMIPLAIVGTEKLTRTEAISNLKLLSQAPALLEIAEAFLDRLESEGDAGILSNHIRTILRKSSVTINPNTI